MDRRTYPRFSLPCPVHFSVDLLGSEFRVERFSSNGTVLDISRKGLLAEFESPVAVMPRAALSPVLPEMQVS